MGDYVLKWPFGEARILTTAAMLAECQFLLPNGRFSPFAKAPWMGRVTDPAIPGHLRELGGDFVCLPFGKGRKVPSAPSDWAPLLTDEADGIVHGPAADLEWQVISASDGAIALALDYPDTSQVLRIERRIAVRQDAPALDFEFRIFARRKAALPVGLHPIFRLPDQPDRLQLSAEFDFGLTHPGYGGQVFQSLAAVPVPGGVVDLSLVPLQVLTDLNVQLCRMRGPLRAIFLDECAGIELDWDRTLLPCLQIWHTNRGIDGAPWHKTYSGIGLEPVAAAFDLGTTVSCGANPINARGIATTVLLDPAAPVTIRHSIRAFAT